MGYCLRGGAELAVAEGAEVRIEPERPDQPDARALIEELDEYHRRLYPAYSNFLMGVESLVGPRVVFLVARKGASQAIGCGAVVFQEDYGEVKRVYVRPGERGRGVGRNILRALEAVARSRGVGVLRLETGAMQTEAMAMYVRSGFRRRGPFGAYPDDPNCRFFEKILADGGSGCGVGETNGGVPLPGER